MASGIVRMGEFSVGRPGAIVLPGVLGASIGVVVVVGSSKRRNLSGGKVDDVDGDATDAAGQRPDLSGCI